MNLDCIKANYAQFRSQVIITCLHFEFYSQQLHSRMTFIVSIMQVNLRGSAFFSQLVCQHQPQYQFYYYVEYGLVCAGGNSPKYLLLVSTQKSQSKQDMHKLNNSKSFICSSKNHSVEGSEIRKIVLDSLQFDLQTIRAATNNFLANNKLGEGGFGEVYKVILFISCTSQILNCPKNCYTKISQNEGKYDK